MLTISSSTALNGLTAYDAHRRRLQSMSPPMALTGSPSRRSSPMALTGLVPYDADHPQRSQRPVFTYSSLLPYVAPLLGHDLLYDVSA
ncbi:unnamed protein product [Linum trigynum]|uniref:Uncharacterized protein n=1 Tax=Linum trigynum TaxID=586398 RepID=A0AAV2E904_9ROSI